MPPLKAKPFEQTEKLVKIKDLPEWSHMAFPGMTSLNRIQSRVCQSALFSSDNMLVCAPTGAGKTNVAVLTMLHEVGLHVQPDGALDKGKFKIVYIAPMKALVAEMVGNFQKRFDPYGLKVAELTGDMGLTRYQVSSFPSPRRGSPLGSLLFLWNRFAGTPSGGTLREPTGREGSLLSQKSFSALVLKSH